MVSAGVIAHARHRHGRAAAGIQRMMDHLSALGVACELTFTDSADEGTRVAAAGAARHDLLIAVGGDGTMHSVIQGMVGSRAVLAIAGAGTGNDGARSLGHPHLDDDGLHRWLDEIIRLIAKPESEAPDLAIDLAHARCADGAAAYYLSVLSCGFDALVNDRAHRLPRVPARARYVVATLLELPRCVGRHYTITLPWGEQTSRAVLIAVGNGGIYGRGMLICPKASVRDGLLDLTIISTLRRTTLLRLFPRVFSGTHVQDHRVSTLTTPRVQISGPELTCYADGERLGPLPVSVEVAARALRVAPPAAGREAALV